MATKGTKVPAIKNVPAKTDPELRSTLDSIKEAVEVRLGRRGDPRDRAVTLRELIDSGLADELKDNPFNPNGGGGVGITPPKQPPGNLDIPPAPTGLEASGAFTTIVVSWNVSPYGNHAYTEVWRARSDDLGGALLITTTNAFVIADPVDYGSTYYYWVRFVSTSDVKGPFNDTNGTKAETEVDIGAVMEQLSEELKNLPGFQTLNSDLTVSLDGVTRTLQATLEALDAATDTANTNLANLNTNTPRVIRSTSAPTTRVDSTSLRAGDLWIDTDSSPNVNEIFVYTGSTWAASTSGSTSSSDTTLQTQITANGNSISQNASDLLLVAGVSDNADISTSVNITTLNASITNGTTGLAANASAISTLNGTVVSQGSSISTQSGQITELQNTLTGYNSSSTLATAVQGLQTQITANDTELGAKASAASVTALTTVVEAKAKTFVQNEPPTSIAIGDLWVDANDKNKLYRAASVGADAVTSGEWVAINDQSGITVFAQDAEPTGTNQGDLWFDTNDNKKQYRFDGTNWVAVDDTRISSSATAVSNLSTAVGLNGSNSTKITTLENALTGYSGSGAVSSAITALTQNITNNDGDITSINNSITSLTNTVTAKTQTFIATSAPTAIAVGDIWIDSDDNNKMYRATAANNSSWVAVNDTSGVAIFAQASQPTGQNEGDLWFDTDDSNKQYRYNGSAWVAVVDTRVAANATAVSNLSTAVGLSGASSTKITNLEATVNHAQTGVAATASAVNLLTTTVSSIPVNFNQANAPSSVSSTLGDLWIDSDDNKLYRFDGSSWQPKRDSTLTAASTAISSLQTNVAGNTADISSNSTAISDEITARATAISQVSASVGTKNQTFVGDTTPTAITIGDLWIKPSENNQLYRATATGTGGWSSIRDGNIASVQSTAATAIANAATAQGTADGKVTTFFQSSIPATGIKSGDLWIDSDDNKLYRASSDGSDEIKAGEWVAVQDQAIATAILDAATAQSTADGKIVTFYEANAPSATSVGDLWVDTDDNELYRATGTGTGNWVSVRDTTNDNHPRIFTETTAPTAVNVGDLWFDTDDSNKQYRWSGSAWVLVRDVTTSASVTTLSSAVSDIEGNAAASYVLQVNTNGAVAGMVIESNASGGTSSSAIQFQADRFAIWDGSGASSSNSVAPFIVDSGIVYIDTARIKNGSIESAKIGTLSADKITFGTMDGARITAGTINVTDLNANGRIIATDLSNNTTTVIHGGNITTNTIAATSIVAGSITGDQINTDLLNVKSFDNVSSTIKSHTGAFVPLGVEASVQSWFGTYPGQTIISQESSSYVNIGCTTTNVRNNAKYRVVYSAVLGDVRNGTIQYSFNNSTWVSLSPKVNANAGNYRTYVFIWDGQITGMSSSQNTVYWRITWNVSGGQVNSTYQSLYVTMDNTQ